MVDRRWQVDAFLRQPIETRGLDANIDLIAVWNRGTSLGSPLPQEFVALDPLAISDLAPFRIQAAVEVRF